MKREFVIIPFRHAPYTQAFRYKGFWWRRTMKGGEKLKDFVTDVNFESPTPRPPTVVIAPEELIATEKSFLTEYDEYANMKP